MGVRVERVSKEAILTIAFNVSVFNELMGTDQFNNKSLLIKMKKAYSDETYDIPWTVVGIERKKILIYLNFTDPKTISRYSEKDSLIVRFIKGSKVLAYQSDEEQMAIAYSKGELDPSDINLASSSFTINQNFVLNNIIPKQAAGGAGSLDAMFASSANAVKGSVNSVLFGNLLLNIIL